MPLPNLPLELLLMIAHHIRDDDGELRYDDFNSFLQVNRALYACLNRILWEKARMHEVQTRRAFAHLIKTNNLAGLEFFLELGADVEVRLPNFHFTANGRLILWVPEATPLLIAAALDNVPLARLLLKQGAKVQYFDQWGGTFSPMHAARSPEMVLLLLDHNADPDFRDNRLFTPLYRYVERGFIAAMRAVLQHGAEVNGREPFEIPLHYAAQRNFDAVQLLLEYGADVELRDYDLNTPLHAAAEAGKTDVVRLLMERWPQGKEARNRNGKTPLLMFEEGSRREIQLSDEEKKEIIALLGGQYSEANNA
jgi:ankyrin repeat protein